MEKKAIGAIIVGVVICVLMTAVPLGVLWVFFAPASAATVVKPVAPPYVVTPVCDARAVCITMNGYTTCQWETLDRHSNNDFEIITPAAVRKYCGDVAWPRTDQNVRQP